MKRPIGAGGVGWSIQNIAGGAFFHLSLFLSLSPCLAFASNASVTHLAHQEIRTRTLGNVCEIVFMCVRARMSYI